MAVVFRSNGNTVNLLTLSSTGSTAKSITCDASTWTIKGDLNLSGGNLTFNQGTSNFTFPNASKITMQSGVEFATLTANASGTTYTLGSDVTVNSSFTCSNAFGAVTYNGNNMICKGDLIRGAAGDFNTNGTTTFKIQGSGNQTVNLVSSDPPTNTNFRCKFIINSSGGTVTFSNNLMGFLNDWTYTAGTVAFGTSTIEMGSDTFNFSPGGLTFANLTFSGGTYTLDSAATVTGTMLIKGVATANNNTINCQGDVKYNSPENESMRGTTTFNMNGGANQTITLTSNATPTNTDFRNPFVINKSGNTLTFANTSQFFSGGFTYTAGTVAAGTSTLGFQGTMNLSGGTMVFNNVTIAGTVTLTGNLDVNGALTINASSTLSCGSNTINCAGNFTNSGTFTRATSTVVFDGTTTVVGATSFNLLTFSASSVNLASSANFVAASTFTANGGGAANMIVLTATTSGQRAILRVSAGQSVSYVSATDIDSSGGNAVLNLNGTISNTINWSTPVPATDLKSYIFMAA